MQQDDENVSQIKYLQKFYETIKAGTSTQEFVESIKVEYNDTCTPSWYSKSTKNYYDCLFNVYPKEWLITEATQDGLLKYDFEKLRSIEPFWKLIAANKAMLPLLWSMYPGHQNLLPAYYDDPIINQVTDVPKDSKWVSKPIFGREGLGVFLSNNFTSYDQFVKTTEDNFGYDAVTNEKLGKSIY